MGSRPGIVRVGTAEASMNRNPAKADDAQSCL